jgi:uncharacterized membrane protein/uncharacterized BrkB/YihY/UPF0761 family membrane protein
VVTEAGSAPADSAPAEPPGPPPQPAQHDRPGRVARARQAGTDAFGRLVAARPRFRAVDAAFELWDRDRSKAATLLAGALVYRLFVWLLPVCLLLASLLGFLAQHDADAPADVAREGGVSSYLVNVVADAAADSRSSRWFTLFLALFGLAVAGKGTVGALRLSHALVWDTPLPKMRRAWVGPLTLLGVTVLAGAAASLSWKARDIGPGIGLGGAVLSSAALAGVWLLASWLLPHDGAAWWGLIPGALLGGVSVLALQLVTVYYLASKLETASDLYGSLGAAAAVLLWLSLLARIAVVAAGLNATLWHRRSRRAVPPDGVPGPTGAPTTLTVWRFPTPGGAHAATPTLADLQRRGVLAVHEAAVVSWEDGAGEPRTRPLAEVTGAGALSGAFWGLLFGVVFFVPVLAAAAGAAVGALGESLSSVGLDEERAAAVRREVVPGTSALFVVSIGPVPDEALDAFIDAEVVSG